VSRFLSTVRPQLPTYCPFPLVVGDYHRTVSGYEFDLFISYSRYGSVQKWLLNHFYKKLWVFKFGRGVCLGGLAGWLRSVTLSVGWSGCGNRTRCGPPA